MNAPSLLTLLAGAVLMLLALIASVARSQAQAEAFATAACEVQVAQLDRRLRWLELGLAEWLAARAQQPVVPEGTAAPESSW